MRLLLNFVFFFRFSMGVQLEEKRNFVEYDEVEQGSSADKIMTHICAFISKEMNGKKRAENWVRTNVLRIPSEQRKKSGLYIRCENPNDNNKKEHAQIQIHIDNNSNFILCFSFFKTFFGFCVYTSILSCATVISLCCSEAKWRCIIVILSRNRAHCMMYVHFRIERKRSEKKNWEKGHKKTKAKQPYFTFIFSNSYVWQS